MTNLESELTGIEQLPQPDPRGWLAVRNLPDEFQRREDQTAHADYEARHWRASVVQHRRATEAEKALLTALGYYGGHPANLITEVSWPSSGVRKRRWPQLEDTRQEN